MSNLEMGLLILASVHLLAFGCLHIYITGGLKKIQKLKDLPMPPDDLRLPSLSVVVAALNEQDHIEGTLVSLLELDYLPLEVIVINDRSTDSTAEMIERVADQYPALVQLHIDSLPDGWLGKNHALQKGAEQAAGEYILFTDADVVFETHSVRRAVAHAVEQQVDHLTVLPQIQMPSLLLESFVVKFARFFLLYFKPWKVPDPNSSAYVGIGAFNLVRAAAYREAGLHEPIRMRPDDDVQLGKLMKTTGFRSLMVDGMDELSVPWYGSLGELIRGLEKNVLAGVDYQLSRIVLAVSSLICFYFWPFVALLVVPSPAWWIYLWLCEMMLLSSIQSAVRLKVRWWAMILYPLTVLLFAYILTRNVFLTYWRGGIQWRGTHYSLKQLRANKT